MHYYYSSQIESYAKILNKFILGNKEINTKSLDRIKFDTGC